MHSAAQGAALMSYQEAIEYLYSLRLFGAKLGLENTLRLAELAGNPQERLRFIHVAGTNGKGSTCAMLESVYRAAGLRTGLFTSPHLISFCERLQVDRKAISETDVVRLVAEIKELIGHFPPGAHPTFFEVITVMALKYFADQQCEIVVWETGLGGRLDATNIVTPLASVITNVACDHEEWLGDTLEKIAFEKAGIIKPQVPVVVGPIVSEAFEIIQRTALERHSPPFLADSRGTEPIELSLLGAHQQENAALVLQTIRVLQSHIAVSESVVRKGLQSVVWPGRLQLVTTPKGQVVLLDGAHNVAGALALARTIEQLFQKKPRALALGILRDKDYEQICRILAPLFDEIFLCPVESERTAPPDLLLKFCAAANPTARLHCCDSLAEALDQINAFTVLTGSLYFVGQALELLRAHPARSGERGLNEWTATRAP
jgi:dihydrofolate synthase/folylpolyglutamate synthase